MERFFKRPWLIVAVIGAITVFFAAQLPRAQLDNNNFRFVPEKDPERVLNSEIDETFGGQIMVLVGLERRHGSVLDADFLAGIREYCAKVKALEYVGSVMSIVNTDYITGDGESIIVEPLVGESFAGTAAELDGLRDRLLSWDMYRRSIVNDDFTATQVIVSLDIPVEDAGKPDVVAVSRKILDLAYAQKFPGTGIYVAGLPVLSSSVNDAMRTDLVILIPLVIIVVVGVLFFSFRRLSGIVLPLLTVAISAVWAVGAMPLFGVRLSILSTVLPVILVAVGSAYGIHVVSHYYDEMIGKRDVNDAAHREIIYGVLRKIAAPVALAALTTFAGFGSFCFTQVVPIFEFGIFSSFGVIVAFVVSLTLIPALLIIRGPARRRGSPTAVSASDESAGDTFGLALADSLTTIASHRRLAFACAFIVVIVSVFGTARLVIDNVMVEYFKSDSMVARSDRFIREQFGGSKSVSVVVGSKNPGDVLRPDVLSAMDGLETYLNDKVPEVGKVIAFTDLVKRVNQVFNVDESPDGIAPVSVAGPTVPAKPARSEPAFGFGSPTDGESEPAFGFAAATESVPVPAKPSSVSQPAAVAAKPLDGKALAALLARAVASSGASMPTADGLVKQLYRATNYRGYAYYEIPVDPVRYGKSSAEELKGLVSNYLVLLSGDIHSYSDDPLEPKSIRMMVQLRTVGQRDTDRAIAAIRDYAADRFPPDVTVKVGGTALVERSLNVLVVQSQLVSVFASLLMVFLILAAYYRSAIAGLIGMIPLSIAVLVNFAVMGFAGIKLNIGTAMVASVAVGTGIDYTIHYMAAYHREYLASGGQGNFVRHTFLSSGKAILFNAVSVGAGFLVLALSQFNILAQLGVLVAIGMGTSSLAALTVLPALLNLIHPAFITRPRKTELKTVFTEVTK